MALHYASENEVDPQTCLLIKDILTGVSKDTGDNPPSTRIFSIFVSWGLKVNLKRAVIDSVSPFRPVLVLSSGPYPNLVQRHIPGNFTIEELATLLLATGDFPKTKLLAKSLFDKKEAKSHKHEKSLQNERA